MIDRAGVKWSYAKLCKTLQWRVKNLNG